MTLAPLLAASPAIQLHAFAAMAAFVLGLAQFGGPKGTGLHRTLGWLWVVLMLMICISAFWIHELRVFGPWSPIHLLAIFTLVMLPIGVLHARRASGRPASRLHDLDFCGALLIAGLFTFFPGRIMHAVLIGH